MIRKIYITIILLFFIKISYCQNDTSLIKILNKPIINCEVVATNSQTIISTLSYSQIDCINKILDIWENECGKSEPLTRVRILFDIKNKTYIDTVYQYYITNHIDLFKDRIKAGKEYNYKGIYDYNKAYFDYVPLKGDFDEWTKSFAENLLSLQSKGTSEYLLCLLFSEKIELYDFELSSKEYKDCYLRKKNNQAVYNDWEKGFLYSVYTGAWLPFGNISNTFNLSPQIGVNAGFPAFNENFRLNFGALFRLPIKYSGLTLNIDDSIYQTKCKFSGNFGAMVNYQKPINENYFWDLYCGANLEFIETDLKTPNPKDEEDTNFGIETFNITFGSGFRRKIFTKRSIGIVVFYQFIPYNINKALVTDLNGSAISLNLIYRF